MITWLMVHCGMLMNRYTSRMKVFMAKPWWGSKIINICELQPYLTVEECVLADRLLNSTLWTAEVHVVGVVAQVVSCALDVAL